MQREVMQRAVVGKTAIFFHGYTNGHANDINVYLDDGYWYAVAGHGEPDWCYLYSDQPVLLRLYCGSKERLAAAVRDVVAGKEVVVPCMVDGNMDDLRRRATKVQQLRASLKLHDYNPKRDFVGWGARSITALAGMPGFTHRAALPRVDPEAQAISCMQHRRRRQARPVPGRRRQGGPAAQRRRVFNETALPGVAGCRAAVWADYNGDGQPDLFWPHRPARGSSPTSATATSATTPALLPKEACYNLTAAAWIDYDGDGRPDILLGNGFHGLRLYRNKGLARAGPLKPGELPRHAGFEDVSAKVGLGPDGIGGHVKGDTLTVCDVNGDGRPDFLYGAGSGILVLNTPKGFVEAKDSGISYKPGKVGPVFGDFDNSGHPGLFVPQLDGRCKLFKNDGKGHFTDVTAQAGDLAKLMGTATCAAWGDFDNDGQLDLVVGCLRGPNRFFRNQGDGTFEDATEALGLHKHIFNTQAVCLVDLNNDGMLDMVFNNEGQESCVLLGNPRMAGRQADAGVDPSDGPQRHGWQSRAAARQERQAEWGCMTSRAATAVAASKVLMLVLPRRAGTYRVEVRSSAGVIRAKEVTVGTSSVAHHACPRMSTLFRSRMPTSSSLAAHTSFRPVLRASVHRTELRHQALPPRRPQPLQDALHHPHLPVGLLCLLADPFGNTPSPLQPRAWLTVAGINSMFPAQRKALRMRR